MEPAEDRDIESEDIEKAGGEYYGRLVDFMREYAPWLLERFHLAARGYAGGKTSLEPSFVEKMTILAISPATLEHADNQEIVTLHRRTHQIWLMFQAEENS